MQEGETLIFRALQLATEKMQEASASLYAGEVPNGLKLMGGVVDILQELTSLLSCQFTGEAGEIEEFNRVLVEVLQAWANADYVQMADLLAYELVPKLESWKRLLN